MPIKRAEHKENFTQILNDLLSDNRLSYGARGLMAYVLTHCDNWVFNGENYFITDLDKLSKVKRYLKELIDYGYLRRYQEKNSRGVFRSILYIFSESPILGKPLTDLPITENQITVISNEKSDVNPLVNFPLADLPLTDSPLAENHTLNNTNINNTNKYIYSSIFEHWNSKGIKKHRELTKDIEKAINKSLKIRVEGKPINEDDIKKAIDNYCEILHSKFYFNYKWTLVEFLTRKQKDTGISQLVLFLDNGTTYENYIRWQNGKSKNSNSEDWRF